MNPNDSILEALRHFNQRFTSAKNPSIWKHKTLPPTPDEVKLFMAEEIKKILREIEENR